MTDKCRANDKKQPSMQAADVVRVTGIGRNEYIATMNKCKAKKLLWRVNKALAKEFLPTEPLVPAAMQPWWLVATVNLGMLMPGHTQMSCGPSPLMSDHHWQGHLQVCTPQCQQSRACDNISGLETPRSIADTRVRSAPALCCNLGCNLQPGTVC